jgi:sugar lactone lactonase YvrE
MSTQEYVVTVSVSANSAKAITSFSFESLSVAGVITESTHTIAVTVPYGTNVKALVPTIAFTGSSVSPGSRIVRDFTSPVTYTVTAADASTQAYVVTVSFAKNTAKAITGFSFTNPPATGVVSESAHSIAVTVPYGTDVKSLIPTIICNGASVSPESGVATDFSNPVIYTVKADDASIQEYVVTVTVAKNSAKAFTAFSFVGSSSVGVISGNKITAAVSLNADVTNLVPTFITTGESVTVGTTVQISGVTSNDFSNPVTYTVTAADGSTCAYSVSVLGGTLTQLASGTAFLSPMGIAVDAAGAVYFAEYGKGAIVKIVPPGVVSTVTNGALNPDSVAADAAGSVYMTDSSNSVVRKFTSAGQGTIVVSPTQCSKAHGVAIDAAGTLYIADTGNNRILVLKGSELTPLSTSKPLDSPDGIALDGSGNIFVSESSSNIVYKIGTDGTVTEIAKTATLNSPMGIAVDTAGDLFIADYANNRVCRVTPSGIVTDLAGSRTYNFCPSGVAVDASGHVFVSSSTGKIYEIQ